MEWFKASSCFWKKPKVSPTAAFNTMVTAIDGSGSNVTVNLVKPPNESVVAIPESAPKEAVEEVVPEVSTWLTVRQNGFQLPPSLWQVCSSGLMVYFEVTTHCLLYNIPYFTPLLVVQDLVLVVLVGASVYTMTTNAAIPQVKHKRLVYPGRMGVDEDNYCHTCETHVPRRTKHCNYCNKCVFRFDHHCYVANNCIGSSNYHGFLTMLVTVVIVLLFLATLSATAIGLYFALGFNAMFGVWAVDFRVWIFLNALNCLATLIILIYEFLPVLHIQRMARGMGLTQFEYHKHLSAQRREREAAKEAAQLEAVVVQ